MNKFYQKKFEKISSPPGTPIYIGIEKNFNPNITLINYNSSQLYEEKDCKVEDLIIEKSKGVFWINISGVHNSDLIKKIGQKFNIDELTLEDIMNTDKRPKIDLFDEYKFLIFKALAYNQENEHLICQQISLIIFDNLIISFQENKKDIFRKISERLKKSTGKIREKGSDYLAYSLIDIIVDDYFLVLEKLGDKTEQLEKDLLFDLNQFGLEKLQLYKKELLFVRRSIWPLREVLNNLLEENIPLMNFYKDLYDHVIELIDLTELTRDILKGVQDLYHTKINTRMNRIMSVLTIISTIFIPLSFITGIYGMNFKYMPELKLKWGYPAVLVLMLLIFLLLIFYFKRKKWL